MTSRETLKYIADYCAAQPQNGEDAAALRELDQLLISMADCLKHDCERNNNGPVNKQLRAIELRLAQAGYGEK